MQAAMWLILGGTVGLAALVNHERRRSMRVELGPPTSHGWLVVRLPKTWQASPLPAAGDRDDRIIARAIEPDEQGLGRTITITLDRVDEPISPLQFLLSSNNQILGLDLLRAAPRGPDEKDLVEPITVGGHPGVLMRGVRAALPGRGGAGAGGLPHKEIYGATIVPSGHAIVVKLEGDRPAELSDIEIVKQLASALEINGQPSLGQSGETVALEGGIRVAAPEGFRPVYENDENLLRRRLWPDGDATRWSAAELIPCVLAPTENNDEAMAIKALAAVYDPALRDAVVVPDGARRWRITPGATSGPFAPRGYLVADDLGDAGAITGGSPRRALMAFFHGASAAHADDAAAAAADAAWDALARSVSFVGKTNFGAMLDTGKDEVARLRKAGLLNLLDSEATQWWLWTEAPEKRPIGWSRVHWKLGGKGQPASDTTGSAETVFELPGGGGRRRRASMTWNGELRTYGGFATLTRAEPDADPVLRQVHLEADKLRITLISRGQSIAEGAGTAPPQYVPGAWLPLLIGKLSPSAMILKTDALLGRDLIGAPIPLFLIIQPVTEQPAPTDADGAPLRCVSVRVNGSSEGSRWYIRPKGDVVRVTYARGVSRTPMDKQTKWFTFGPDAPATQ